VTGFRADGYKKGYTEVPGYQQGEGHHCYVYILMTVVVNMSLDRQCLRKSPGNFLGETKRAFRESCEVIAY